MKIIVENQNEAVEVSRKLFEIESHIRHSSLDDILQTSFGIFLGNLRNTIEAQDKKGEAA